MDTIRSGLRTTFVPSARPPSLRVDWIAWDSGFRGTGLRAGDDIIAVDGVPVNPKADQTERARMIGQDQEPAHWAARGARSGDAVVVTARRKRLPGEGWEQVDVKGTLGAERMYTDSQGRAVLGPGGPPRLERDNFPDGWASWYGKRVFDWEKQLDGGVWRRGGNSRMELARHLEAEARVRFLRDRYPGPFATAVADDWEGVRRLLEGRLYRVDPDEYVYRDVEARVVNEVTAAAKAAWDSFKAAHAASIVPPPGPLNLVAGDDIKLAGKLLLLPPASPNGWISDVAKVLVSWYENRGWVLTPLESPVLDRMWHAQIRYKRHVSPVIDDVFAMVGRILPETRMITPKDQTAVVGVEVEPLATLMGRGDKLMFVDLTAQKNGVSEFSGEASVRIIPSQLPPDDASPRQVLEALIAALYARDEQTWFSLFADWHFFQDETRPFYYPYYPYPESRREADWTRSRRAVLEQTFALRVVWLGEPRVVARDELPGVPLIERVEAEIDHVGLFNGELRAFASVDVHRHWTLERQDGGPWRITSHQGI